ncbi:Non-ribosomal peptide synthetase [Elusimicrobium minutum Pei191]|uniref:Non-ribosomal peptide synthetase n=1 Tax=Elusimicrobium minutum (strain Pei191) TaxID=445932 RepID=B2KDF2_ELUMP|nr:non-ribosomal peptide synthetase [Elusimicrobium minutum]ACC98548.1 Non-ribosomal peptide synthetase [Elusimicrobium minutum Pei191]
MPIQQRKTTPEVWPLTYNERQIITEYGINPGSTVYNIKFEFTITGELDEIKFEKALCRLIERHRIMRSHYPLRENKFIRKIFDKVSNVLTIKECSLQLAKEEINASNKPYDISNDKLFRFTLFKVGQKKNIFLFEAHHIIIDGIGISIFINELWQLYENENLKLPLQADYLDFAVSQQNNEEELKKKKKFFKNIFVDGVPENDMPIAIAKRPDVLPASNSRLESVIEANMILNKAKEFGVMPYVIIMAACAVTIGKYCASEDITFGSAMSGRDTEETKNIVGMFSNIIPLRLKPKGDMLLKDFIAEAAVLLKEAKKNQSYPLSSLVSSFVSRRDLSRHPLFDVIVNYLYEFPDVNVAGLTIRQEPRNTEGYPVDLQFEFLRRGDIIRLVLSYSDILYESRIPKNILEQLEFVIKNITAKGSEEKKLSSISLLPEPQRNHILKKFKGSEIEYDKTMTVIDVFEQNAKDFPENPAIKYEDKVLTYKQVKNISDNIAAKLRERGVKKGDCIAILVKRSELMPVCVLGAVKAGAAYVPFDFVYPPERLKFMLQQTKAKILIADEDLLYLLPECECGVLLTKDIYFLKSPEDKKDIAGVAPSDCAVVLYTSGTTGTPKGVIITHANIMALCVWVKQKLGVKNTDNMATYASFGFDASMMDIFSSLYCGSCLHVIADELKLDLTRLNDYFEKNSVTSVFMTTQMGRKFAETISNNSLKYLMVGGEALVPLEPPKGYLLYNGYGPTECTACASMFIVDKLYERIPLGKPVPNSAIFMLDKYNNIAPVGVVGELCIAGPQLAKGYLDNPQETKEKFVENPFIREAGFDKIYRTGDIARYLPGGDIDFMGRRDSQVKIRGFRVELTEIEGRIRAYPAVKDAVVIANDAPGGGKRALAYIVADKKIDITELHKFIEQELPSYMVPATTTQIEAIPFNPNGKVAHRKLPPPVFGVVRRDNFAAPQGIAEKEIAIIWAEILGIKLDKISANDNFFDLGGTSLSTTELVLRIREIFNKKINPAEIFRYPVLRQQSEYLSKNNPFPMIHVFSDKGAKNPMFFVHTGNTGPEAYLPLARKLRKDCPFYGIEPYNLFQDKEIIAGVENIAKKYIQYMHAVKPQGPYILGGWSFGGLVAYEMAAQLSAQGESIEKLFLLDPGVDYSEQRKKLNDKLNQTSFFHDYLKNDPMFERFKKLGLTERLVENNKRMMNDIFSYNPKPYGGKVILFKSTKISPVPRMIKGELRELLFTAQTEEIGRIDNGFSKYVNNLEIIKIEAVHDDFMKGGALEKIIARINKDE